MILSHPVSSLTQDALLHRIANRVRQSLELETILSTTAAEVRDYLGTDRVKIYQFYPEGHGVVVAEALQANRLPSLLGLHFPADDIPRYARELFVRARQRSIVDMSTHAIGISPLNSPETGELLDSPSIRYRPVDPCHWEYLMAMGVQSSVVVPIVLEGEATSTHHPPTLETTNQLWGLLVSHHSEPRTVTEAELEFIQAVVDQVAVGIAQSILLEQVRSQARQEANINQVTARLQTSPTVDWSDVIELAASTLNAGGRLYLSPDTDFAREIYTCGEQPALIEPDHDRSVEENLLWQKYLSSVLETASDGTGHRPWSTEWMRSVYALAEPSPLSKPVSTSWAIDDIYQEPLFRTLAPYFDTTKIRSALIIPLKHGTQILGCLTFFRNEVDIEIQWAGYHNPDTRQLMPRQSFSVWRQTKKKQAQGWTDEEIRYAQALGERFAATVKQYRLYQQVQSFNSSLEGQVTERTEALQKQSEQLQQSNAELEQVVKRQMALSHIVAKIRESLDIDTIFQIATQDLCMVLQSERVAIYRFTDNWGGAFVSNYESVIPAWKGLGELGVNTVWNDTHLQETQGGRYRTGDSSVVSDIYQQNYAQCHIDILEQYHIKAFMTFPIFVGRRLWGLLGVYQHSTPREWRPSEIEFVKHVAVQLGVALQHAELLTQTQQQAEQLNQTLNDLKQAQVQLFHSEKMSSLGQLVAGIAHEVNNPISFISGNLVHIQEYINTLFKLIRSYQQFCPNPSPELLQLLEESEFEYIQEDLPKICLSMEMGTTRIREIVQSLRNFSRVDEAEVKAVDLHEGIESTLLMLQHRFKAIGGSPVEIVKHYGDLPKVECHAGQLNQVYMNLIGNAIDELEDADQDAPKILTLSTYQIDPEQVAISIKDNGRGIPEEVRAKLFDPFFTTKPIGKGTGLGLFISYQIVEKHGGQLLCHSQIGHGTEFVIILPVR